MLGKLFVPVLAALMITFVAGTGALAAACCAGSASCAAVTAIVADNALTPQEQADGRKLLFDGKTFDGWGCTDKSFPEWSLKDGAIVLGAHADGYLYTKDQFTNFELKIDFMVDTHTNSGIFFRWANLADPVQTGFEMQVLDSAGKNPPDRHDSGALYDILAPSENAMKPAHQWNTVVITCRNSFVTIAMNGKRIVRADLDKYTEEHKNIDGSGNKYSRALKDYSRTGHIGLQAHGGAAWYKNIKIREIK